MERNKKQNERIIELLEIIAVQESKKVEDETQSET